AGVPEPRSGRRARAWRAPGSRANSRPGRARPSGRGRVSRGRHAGGNADRAGAFHGPRRRPLPGRAGRRSGSRLGPGLDALVRSGIGAPPRSCGMIANIGEENMDRRRFLSGAAAIAAGAIAKREIAEAETEISFSYPVAVGGPITKIIDGFAADFEKQNPRIKVKPIYAGTYQESLAKALTAHKSGTAPVTSVLLSTDMFSLIDEDAVVPFDDFATSEADRKWLGSFFPAFMYNSQTGGKTWGIPFQRSTIVLYWNKEAFREAGLDPERAPANWAEQASFAEKLTKRDGSGNVTEWGLQIPSSGFPYWLFQGLAIQNGEELMNRARGQPFFAQPPA